MRFIPLLFAGLCMAAPPFAVRTVMTKSGGVPASYIQAQGLKTGAVYSFLLDVDASAKIQLVQPSGTILSKTLQEGDRDFYATFHALEAGPAQLRFEAGSGNYRLQINELPASSSFEQEPHNRWQDASAIQLGQPVFGS